MIKINIDKVISTNKHNIITLKDNISISSLLKNQYN